MRTYWSVVAFGILAVVAGCGRNVEPSEDDSASAGEPVFPVTLGEVRQGTIEEVAEIVGTTRWRRTVTIESEVAGRVAMLDLDVGDRFDEGETLVRLDDRDHRIELDQRRADLARAESHLANLAAGTRPEVIRQLEARLRAAKAQLELARDELQRTRRLFAEEVATEVELARRQAEHDTAAATVAEGEADLEQARNGPTPEEFAVAESAVAVAREALRPVQRRIDKCVVTAPFAGIVLRKFTEFGAFVGEEEPLFEIICPTELDVYMEVPERFGAILHDVDRFALTADGLPGARFAGVVDAVLPVADPISRNITLRAGVEAPGDDLLAGMFVRGRLVVARETDAILVPADAVTLQQRERVVFVAADGRVNPVTVTVGLRNDGDVSVRGDLRPGQKVVTTGGELLSPGAKIMVPGEGGLSVTEAPSTRDIQIARESEATQAGGAEQ